MTASNHPRDAMALAATLIYLSLAVLASPTPLQLLNPQTLTLTDSDRTLSSLNLTALPSVNATTLTGITNCFVQPHYPGAPTLLETSYSDCLIAVTVLPGDKPPTSYYTFSRRPGADVRLPYAKYFRSCKIIVDVMDEQVSIRLRWQDISETLEGRHGVLNRCLGQGRLPPLGGRTSVGDSGAMQAIVVGQRWDPDAGFS